MQEVLYFTAWNDKGENQINLNMWAKLLVYWALIILCTKKRDCLLNVPLPISKIIYC
jgi:hypothetical protein